MPFKINQQKVRNRLHNVVLGILAQLPEGGTEPISNVRFMEEMQKIATRHPELFREIAFSNIASVPWSRPLEQILFCLGASGCLHRSPVDKRWYLKGIDGHFDSVIASCFTEKELAIIIEEGRRFALKVQEGKLAD